MPGHLLLATSAAGPSWYWYATRGLGTAALVVLTASLVLGIGTSARWSGSATPGFVVASLHRNLSLLSVLLVVAHIVSTILDPFAKISVRDAIIPFGAAYRPVWLGLGVAAAEVLLAVTVTSLLRDRLGPRRWKLVHWAAYGSWPLAVVHGLGTGSDAQAPWMIGVVAACLMAVWLVVSERLLNGRILTLPIRFAAAVLVTAGLYSGAIWAFNGPFQRGWAARAGTPSSLLNAEPVHPGPGGFSDPLVGVMARAGDGSVQISMRDMVDTGLTVSVRSPNSNETLPVVTIARDGRQLCQSPASVGTTLYAVCGQTRLTITLYGTSSPATGNSNITGRLAASGPLNH